MTACISLDSHVLFYFLLKFLNSQHGKALIDTGACANAVSERDYEDLKFSFGTTATISQPTEVSKVKLASGQVMHLYVAKSNSNSQKQTTFSKNSFW